MPPSRAQSSSRPSRNPGENNTTGQAASTSQPTSYYQLFSSTVDEADDTLPLTGDRQQQEAAAAQQQEQDLFDAKNESNSPQERYQRVSLTALWKNLDSRAFYEVANPKGPTSSSIGALTRPPSGLTLLDSSSRIRLTEDGVQSFISFHQGVADRRAPQEFLHQICHRNMTRLALANSVKFTNSLLTELKDAQQIIQARDKTIDQLRKQLLELRQTRARTKAAKAAPVRARSRSVPGAFEPLVSEDDEPVREPALEPARTPSPSPSPPPRRREKTRSHREPTRETPATQASSSGKRSARFPDPKMFSGSREKDAVDYRTWKEDLDSKLLVNADHFETDLARSAYIMTRLEGDARQHASALAAVRGGPTNLLPEELVDRLTEVFNDPNRELDAKEKLRGLRMTYLQDARDFVASFSHLATEGRLPINSWKEELHYRVYDTLKLHMLSAAEDPMISYQGYSAQLISRGREVAKVAQNQRSRTEKAEKAARFSSGASAAKPASRAEKSTSWRATAQPPAEPSALPAHSKEKTSTTAAAGSDKSELRCYNCGELGHISPKCTKPKRAPTKEVEPHEATTSDPNAEADAEDTPSEPDSEN